LVILFLCVTGYLVTGQLRMASQTASQLGGAEMTKKIEIRIQEIASQLKRFPDAKEEFQQLVLGCINTKKYKQDISVTGFVPGNTLHPARFAIKIGGAIASKPVLLRFCYYGVNYHREPRLKGRLIRQ